MLSFFLFIVFLCWFASSQEDLAQQHVYAFLSASALSKICELVFDCFFFFFCSTWATAWWSCEVLLWFCYTLIVSFTMIKYEALKILKTLGSQCLKALEFFIIFFWNFGMLLCMFVNTWFSQICHYKLCPQTNHICILLCFNRRDCSIPTFCYQKVICFVIHMIASRERTWRSFDQCWMYNRISYPHFLQIIVQVCRTYSKVWCLLLWTFWYQFGEVCSFIKPVFPTLWQKY